jgi:hypothetical protein
MSVFYYSLVFTHGLGTKVILIAGLVFSLIISAHHGSAPVYTLPGPPPNAESLIEALKYTEIDQAFVLL